MNSINHSRSMIKGTMAQKWIGWVGSKTQFGPLLFVNLQNGKGLKNIPLNKMSNWITLQVHSVCTEFYRVSLWNASITK